MTFTQASPSRRREVISPKHGLTILVGSMTAVRGDRKGHAMNEMTRSSWYVSRRVEAPALVVADVVRWLLADGPITVVADHATLTVGPVDPAGLVWPSPHSVTRTGSGCLGRTGLGFSRSRRSAPGRSGHRRWFGRRRAVDLEVEAWSHDACELALRPTSRRLPLDSEAYAEAASATLDRIRDVVVRLLGAPEEPTLPVPLRRAS